MFTLSLSLCLSILVCGSSRWFVHRGMAPLGLLSTFPLRAVVFGTIAAFAATTLAANLMFKGILTKGLHTSSAMGFSVCAMTVTGLFSASIELFSRRHRARLAKRSTESQPF